MLPPTCTRVLPSASWTSRAKSLLTPLTRRTKGKAKKGGKGSAGMDGAKSVSEDLVEAAVAAISQAGKGKEKIERAVHVRPPCHAHMPSGAQRVASKTGRHGARLHVCVKCLSGSSLSQCVSALRLVCM